MAASALERSGSPGGESGSSAERGSEVTDVEVDRAIEERVIADARLGEGENLLNRGREGDLRGLGGAVTEYSGTRIA